MSIFGGIGDFLGGVINSPVGQTIAGGVATGIANRIGGVPDIIINQGGPAGPPPLASPQVQLQPNIPLAADFGPFAQNQMMPGQQFVDFDIPGFDIPQGGMLATGQFCEARRLGRGIDGLSGMVTSGAMNPFRTYTDPCTGAPKSRTTNLFLRSNPTSGSIVAFGKLGTITSGDIRRLAKSKGNRRRRRPRYR